MKIKLISLLCCFVFSISFSYSQGCHGGGGNMGSMSNTVVSDNPNKYASYGGIVKKVSKYNIEMVYQPMFKQDPLTFYLMNKKGKPISNKDISGKAELTYADGSTETLTLEPSGENRFAGQMANKTGTFICFVTFLINGENVTARFDGGTSEKENTTTKSTYTCPMHPEIVSAQLGNCPKCGMALVKKSEASGKKMSCMMMGGMGDMNKMENMDKNNSPSTANTAIEKDSIIYTCPMHPEVQEAKPGSCPKCGMTLEKKTIKKSKTESEKKEATTIYTCSMHPEVQSDKPGSCPKCGMNLIEKK